MSSGEALKPHAPEAVCVSCGKTLAEHVATRPDDAPIPRCPCRLLKQHFRARAVSAPSEPPPILKFFAYEHLPPHRQAVSKPIGELARQMAAELPAGAELSAGLRKLLEAKDCFVRAKL